MKFASALMDDEAEARDGQDLEHGADGVHHWRGRIRAQDVVRCGNGEPDEVGEHHQQEEEQAPKVEAEAVMFQWFHSVLTNCKYHTENNCR